MGAYVLFTVFLFQRGSSESKDPDKEDPVDEDPDRHWLVQTFLGLYALAVRC